MDPTYQLNWYIAYSTSAPPSSKLLEAGRVATAVDEIHPQVALGSTFGITPYVAAGEANSIAHQAKERGDCNGSASRQRFDESVVEAFEAAARDDRVPSTTELLRLGGISVEDAVQARVVRYTSGSNHRRGDSGEPGTKQARQGHRSTIANETTQQGALHTPGLLAEPMQMHVHKDSSMGGLLESQPASSANDVHRSEESAESIRGSHAVGSAQIADMSALHSVEDVGEDYYGTQGCRAAVQGNLVAATGGAAHMLQPGCGAEAGTPAQAHDSHGDESISDSDRNTCKAVVDEFRAGQQLGTGSSFDGMRLGYSGKRRNSPSNRTSSGSPHGLTPPSDDMSSTRACEVADTHFVSAGPPGSSSHNRQLVRSTDPQPLVMPGTSRANRRGVLPRQEPAQLNSSSGLSELLDGRHDAHSRHNTSSQLFDGTATFGRTGRTSGMMTRDSAWGNQQSMVASRSSGRMIRGSEGQATDDGLLAAGQLGGAEYVATASKADGLLRPDSSTDNMRQGAYRAGVSMGSTGSDGSVQSRQYGHKRLGSGAMGDSLRFDIRSHNSSAMMPTRSALPGASKPSAEDAGIRPSASYGEHYWADSRAGSYGANGNLEPPGVAREQIGAGSDARLQELERKRERMVQLPSHHGAGNKITAFVRVPGPVPTTKHCAPRRDATMRHHPGKGKGKGKGKGQGRQQQQPMRLPPPQGGRIRNGILYARGMPPVPIVLQAREQPNQGHIDAVNVDAFSHGRSPAPRATRPTTSTYAGARTARSSGEEEPGPGVSKRPRIHRGKSKASAPPPAAASKTRGRRSRGRRNQAMVEVEEDDDDANDSSGGDDHEEEEEDEDEEWTALATAGRRHGARARTSSRSRERQRGAAGGSSDPPSRQPAVSKNHSHPHGSKQGGTQAGPRAAPGPSPSSTSEGYGGGGRTPFAFATNEGGIAFIESSTRAQELLEGGVPQVHRMVKRGRKSKGDQLLPEEAIEKLLAWVCDHLEKPYPDAATKTMLAEHTGLPTQSIKNYLTNLRKRHLTPLKAGRPPRNQMEVDLLTLILAKGLSIGEN